MLPSGHEQVDCHDPLAVVVTIYNRQLVQEKGDHAVWYRMGSAHGR